MREAVIFIILDESRQNMLMEKRAPDQSNAGHYLHIGGHIEFEDADKDDESTRITALLREVKEELDIVPQAIEAILCDPPVFSSKGTLLHPYLISSFEGKLPNVVKDKGNPLVWMNITKTKSSTIESVRYITDALIKHISSI